MRDKLPLEIGTLMWFSYFRPCVNIYSPIYLGIKSFPKDFASTISDDAMKYHFDPPEEFFEPNEKHAYWTYYNNVMNIDSLYAEQFPTLNNEKRFIQDEIIRDTFRKEFDFLTLYKTDPNLASERLDYFSRRMMNYVKDYTKGIISD